MAGGTSKEQNYWPGFVDALSNMVLVVILVLVIFTIALFFFATRVGIKINAVAQEKAKEVIAQVQPQVPTIGDKSPQLSRAQQATTVDNQNGPTAKAQEQGAPQTILRQIGGVQNQNQTGGLDSASQQRAVDITSVNAKRLLNDIREQIAQEPISAERQGQLLQKIAELERDLQANATGIPVIARTGQPQSPSDITVQTESTTDKVLAEGPKGAKLIPGSAGPSNGEVAIVTYSPGAVEPTNEVNVALEKILVSLGDRKRLRIELLAQPSDESYSEAQRLSYYRIIGLRNYLLKQGIAADRLTTRIIERSANPQYKSGAVFIRATQQ